MGLSVSRGVGSRDSQGLGNNRHNKVSVRRNGHKNGAYGWGEEWDYSNLQWGEKVTQREGEVNEIGG